MNDEARGAFDAAQHPEAIDDCWNRIGVRGDGSCPRLADYVHCRNCPVHDAAAARVLDRAGTAVAFAAGAKPEAEPRGLSAESGAREDEQSLSCLVFRVGDEWLGLPTAIFRQVAQLRPIHSLPHRRHRSVLGVVNVRGELLVCASLARLFGIERAQEILPSQAPGGRAAFAVDARELGRLLVIERPGGDRADGEGPIAFPADAVDGVHRFARAAFQPVPATLAHRSASHAHAVVGYKGRTVGLLDAGKLFDTLNRSLT